jgi:hypothetical protein
VYTVPSKLLTSTATHNFDRGYQRFQKIVGASWFKRHPLSKAFKSEILLEMHKKIKDGSYCLLYSLFLTLVLACRSLLSKMCFNVIFLLKRSKKEKIVIVGPLEKLSLKI